MSDLGIIDAWAQPASPRAFAKLPEIRRLFERSGSGELLSQGLDAAQTVARMDDAGIEVAMVCAWNRPEGAVLGNDELAEFMAPFPERFCGVASVDLRRPVAACAELTRAVKELGFRALRVVPWLWNLPPNHRLYYPLYAQCIELGIPFCTQVGHTGPLMPSEPGRPIPYLDDVALEFPELTIVAGHIGHPWTEEMIGLAWKHDNVYIDTSAYLPRYYPAELVQFMKSYGREKVLFGTNFPQLSFGKCVEQAQKLGLPDETLTAFFSGNARRVFGLERTVGA